MKEKKTIGQLMMIDDDEMILMINRHIIQETGKVDRVIPFQSADKALKYLMTADQWPEIILCDIHMPILDGWEFIDHYNQILNKPADQGMLCIHSDISGDYELDELEKRKSIDMFITKPLSREKVLLVADYFSNKYSHPEHTQTGTKFITT